jgi:hypothetical protein
MERASCKPDGNNHINIAGKFAGAKAAFRPARRDGDESEYRLLRGSGGCLYEGNSGMRIYESLLWNGKVDWFP